MNQYLVTYIGGDRPATEAEGQAHFAQYQAWLEALGDAVVTPMVPYLEMVTVLPDRSVEDGCELPISGHTVLQAADMESVQDMVKSCPFLDINGQLLIAEMKTISDH